MVCAKRAMSGNPVLRVQDNSSVAPRPLGCSDAQIVRCSDARIVRCSDARILGYSDCEIVGHSNTPIL